MQEIIFDKRETSPLCIDLIDVKSRIEIEAVTAFDISRALVSGTEGFRKCATFAGAMTIEEIGEAGRSIRARPPN